MASVTSITAEAPLSHKGSAAAVRQGHRNPRFDLLRILFATFVLLAHAVEMADGNLHREPIALLLHTQYNFGALGVDGFFLLSGFLIVQSWLHDPEPVNYLRKRLLRIVPGYLVAALISTAVAGIFAPGIDHFFSHLLGRRSFYTSILMFGNISTPPAYPGRFDSVNGSLWSIPYELRCYLVVLLCGISGIFRRPKVWLGITLVLGVLFLFPVLTGPPEAWHSLYYFTGQPPQIARLGFAFFLGACFWLFRRQITFRPLLALASVVALVLIGVFAPTKMEIAVCLFGAYLIFYFGQMASVPLDWMKRVPDISYGTYLYGGPIEQLWIWHYRHSSPWTTFLVATILSYSMGWLSWHLVERPALKLKRRPNAPLPPP